MIGAGHRADGKEQRGKRKQETGARIQNDEQGI
jgi:hypothetical protein